MTQTTEPDSIRRVSTVEALVEALRTRVLTGDIPPGTQLREVELSTAYRVGRHSLRAALQNLVHEGVLRHEPHRGVFVPTLSPEDVTDLFLLRIALEVEAVRLFVERKLPVDGAEAMIADLAARPADAPWDGVIEWDLAFHRGFIDPLASPRLSRTFASLQAELRLLLAQLRPHYDSLEQLVEEHRLVLDAIETGRVATATKQIRAHLEQGVVDILKLV